jgi:hypothetical protein
MFSKKVARSQAFDVYSRQSLVVPDLFRQSEPRKIDTVFYTEHYVMTAEDVRKQLIEHDGYPTDITVTKVR